MKVKILITFLLLSIFVFIIIINFSTPYNRGKVYVMIKNDTPCFYIKNKNLSGEYKISLEQYQSNKIYYHKNNYANHYPNQENCVLYNADNFSDYQPALKDTNYSVYLESKSPKDYGVYKGYFRLIHKDGVLTAIES